MLGVLNKTHVSVIDGRRRRAASIGGRSEKASASLSPEQEINRRSSCAGAPEARRDNLHWRWRRDSSTSVIRARKRAYIARRFRIGILLAADSWHANYHRHCFPGPIAASYTAAIRYHAGEPGIVAEGKWREIICMRLASRNEIAHLGTRDATRASSVCLLLARDSVPGEGLRRRVSCQREEIESYPDRGPSSTARPCSSPEGHQAGVK